MGGFIGARGGDLSTFDRALDRRQREREFALSLVAESNADAANRRASTAAAHGNQINELLKVEAQARKEAQARELLAEDKRRYELDRADKAKATQMQQALAAIGLGAEAPDHLLQDGPQRRLSLKERAIARRTPKTMTDADILRMMQGGVASTRSREDDLRREEELMAVMAALSGAGLELPEAPEGGDLVQQIVALHAARGRGLAGLREQGIEREQTRFLDTQKLAAARGGVTGAGDIGDTGTLANAIGEREAQRLIETILQQGASIGGSADGPLNSTGDAVSWLARVVREAQAQARSEKLEDRRFSVQRDDRDDGFVTDGMHPDLAESARLRAARGQQQDAEKAAQSEITKRLAAMTPALSAQTPGQMDMVARMLKAMGMDAEAEALTKESADMKARMASAEAAAMTNSEGVREYLTSEELGWEQEAMDSVNATTGDWDMAEEVIPTLVTEIRKARAGGLKTTRDQELNKLLTETLAIARKHMRSNINWTNFGVSPGEEDRKHRPEHERTDLARRFTMLADKYGIKVD